ncbi:MAG: NAD-dependent epimerase/dehydratase family protein [Myxococcota bacterium]|nr:NAD-dependent epimerase/dehydratase family protein [Myxococcota bacterium]
MTVVVTGGSGHVGTNLVRALVAQGRSVRVVFHRNKGLVADWAVEWVQADVRDRASLERAFTGADTVFHLAALISIEGDLGGRVTSTNVEGAHNAACAALAAGVSRYVHVSSVHAFDQQPLDEPLDETRARATHPKHNAYDRSKALGEAKVRSVIEDGLNAVIVNPTGVIGPFDGQPSRMGQVFLDLYHRTLPSLIDGVFDWVDVRDVVAGILGAEEKGRVGESYLLSGCWRSVLELADLAESITGVRRPRLISPMWLARGWAPFQMALDRLMNRPLLYTSESLEALRANRTISHAKAAAEFGYTPRPIEDSVRDVYAWFDAAGRMTPGLDVSA